MNCRGDTSLSKILDVIAAKNSGQTIEEFRSSKNRHDSLTSKAVQIRGAPPSKWPTLIFNWDLTINGRIYSFDSPVFLPNEVDTYSARKKWKESFKEFKLGWVSLEEMDSCLCNYSRRDGLKELWEVGNSFKLAYVVAHISEGFPISPPVIKPTSNDEIILIGGHHRYAAAKAVGEKRIPIYCNSTNKIKVGHLLNIEWVNK